MKISIDEKECLKKCLTFPEVLVAVAMRYNQEESYQATIENLENKGVLQHSKTGGGFVISDNWDAIIEEIISNSSGDAFNEERLMELAKKMRDCYPIGKMPGTPYYYKGNTREVFLSLKRFFPKYGNYSDDDIISATKRFVAAYNGNYRYLPLLKYFILKNKTKEGADGKGHIEEVSELASFLENKDSSMLHDDETWMSSLRN